MSNNVLEASSKLLEAVAVTTELCGRTISPAAAKMFVADLAGFDERSVIAALSRCRREVRGALTVQDVIARIDDGRPGVEEAWAMLPRDEATTVVWTTEMQVAWGIARPLIESGEEVAARMTFKEVYLREITQARERGQRVKWEPSIGFDKNGREDVLIQAVEKGRLSAGHVAQLLPYHEISPQSLALLEKAKQEVGANLLGKPKP